MGIQIEDGTGTGNKAAVDSEGHLIVDALTLSEISHTSDAHGQAFIWASQTYDPDAADTVLLIKNTSSTRNLIITDVWFSADVETRVQIHLPTAEVTVAGTTITGVNMNTASGNVAEASAARDETGNTQGDVIWSGETQAANDTYHVDFKSAIHLGQNKSIGVDFVAAATAGDVTIMGYFE